MKVTPNAQGIANLHRKNDDAGKAALGDVQALAQTQAPRRSGRFAASITATWQDGKGGLASDLPQSGAVERGANVGARRGPHMQGFHTIRNAGDQWGAALIRRLRGAN